MNFVKNSIGWADFTWNPITGCLNTQKTCPIHQECYARNMSKRFGWNFNTMSFHADRLEKPLKKRKPSKIFVGSMADMFHPDVNLNWVNQVLNIAKQCSKHTFMFLTKNPLGYLQYDFPLNCWLGFTDNGQLKKEETLKVRNRHKDNIIFVSLEPFIRYDIGIVKLMDWVIIGGWSQPGKHKIDWLGYESLLDYCDQKDIPLFVKHNVPLMENYGYHYCIRQHWPEEVLGETTI